MQGAIRRHRAVDAALGHESGVAALFEPATEFAQAGLAARGWSTPAGIRRAFLRHIAPRVQGAAAIYHNAWGLPLLAPGDGATRRIAYLHTEWPELDLAVRASAPWVDGFVVVSQALQQAVRRAAPGFPGDRVWRVDYPVTRPAEFAPAPAPPRDRGRFRVGYVGRLEIRQKRVDRLARAMRLADPAWEWHVIGEGPARARLERAAPAGTRFHGWLHGGAYWRSLAALDAVMFFSDFEGTPIALLDALSVGAVPMYPAIGGDAELLAREVDPRCVYAAGDVAEAIAQLARLARDSEPDRVRIARVVAGHTPERYQAGFGESVEAVLGAERRSRTDLTRPARASDWLPMAAVRRWNPGAIWR